MARFLDFLDPSGIILRPSAPPPLFRFADGTFTRASEASYPTGPGWSTIDWAVSGELRNRASLGDEPVGGLLAATFLLENAATNLALRSEELDNAAWSKANAAVTANDIAAPDAEVDADALVGTTVGVLTSASQAALGAAGNLYVFSVWLRKRGTNVNASIRLTDGTSPGALNVTLTTTWTRYQVAITAASAAAVTASVYPHLDTITGTLGANGDDLYVWGAQVELFATGVAATSPAASSYVRTAGATATRVTDSLTFTAAQIPLAMKSGRFKFAYRAAWTNAENTSNRGIFSSDNSSSNGVRWSGTETVQAIIGAASQFASGVASMSTRDARVDVTCDLAAAIMTVNGVPGAAGTPVDFDPTDTTWRIGSSSVTSLWGRLSEFYAG